MYYCKQYKIHIEKLQVNTAELHHINILLGHYLYLYDDFNLNLHIYWYLLVFHFTSYSSLLFLIRTSENGNVFPFSISKVNFIEYSTKVDLFFKVIFL